MAHLTSSMKTVPKFSTYANTFDYNLDVYQQYYKTGCIFSFQTTDRPVTINKYDMILDNRMAELYSGRVVFLYDLYGSNLCPTLSSPNYLDGTRRSLSILKVFDFHNFIKM